MQQARRKRRRKYGVEKYKGWVIRRYPKFWQADNNRRDRRDRRGFATLEQAKAYIDLKAAEVEDFGKQAYALTPAQRLEAVRAYSDLKGRASLGEVVDFWTQHHPDGNAVSLAVLAVDWLRELEANRSRPPTIKEAKHRTEAFMEEVGRDTPCASVTADMVRDFIGGLEVRPITRNGWRRVLYTLFEFGVRRKIIRHNPVKEIARVRLDETLPEFMPQRTVARIMQEAEQRHRAAVPALAVLFFGGLRPSEVGGQYGMETPEVTKAKEAVAGWRKRLKDIPAGGKGEKSARAALASSRASLRVVLAAQRKARGKDPALTGGLQWEDVNLQDRIIRVRPETSKSRRARLVDISDNLLQWLLKYRRPAGRLAPVPPTFKRMRKAIMRGVGLKVWRPDVSRHTFATFHFSQHQDIAKLQAQLGHTGKSDVLFKHYRGLAPQAEAERFWSIAPGGSGRGKRIQLAKAGA